MSSPPLSLHPVPSTAAASSPSCRRRRSASSPAAAPAPAQASSIASAAAHPEAPPPTCSAPVAAVCHLPPPASLSLCPGPSPVSTFAPDAVAAAILPRSASSPKAGPTKLPPLHQASRRSLLPSAVFMPAVAGDVLAPAAMLCQPLRRPCSAGCRRPCLQLLCRAPPWMTQLNSAYLLIVAAMWAPASFTLYR
ncbi:hypothetical protein E2562_016744 [Oryza meyeriana var. granulata]|uniref:Uncharacterized protein n=1 Tax=Oryza meyeriana var. granulata TaxID=110450 RepID=A0A6G1BXM9_9ORYZ|nr:hypothetical protein E2562_016744 [Oryza meyeriana var. granulata]